MFQTFQDTASPEQGPPRLAALREAMASEGLAGFLVPRADAHQGEYVAPCDDRLAWLTGFTGSAGLAVILAKTQDNVRKGDAFAGRVGLPFVDCAPPPPGVLRLGLVSSTGDWVVYKTNSAGTPKIKCRSTGFEGFCECALLFAQSVRT